MISCTFFASDRDDREEQKEFLASELKEAQEGYAQARRKVTAAKIRVQRKIELQDPARAGPEQKIDAKVKATSLKTLEVRNIWELKNVCKLSTGKNGSKGSFELENIRPLGAEENRVETVKF